jgi:hypothetical protein
MRCNFVIRAKNVVMNVFIPVNMTKATHHETSNKLKISGRDR